MMCQKELTNDAIRIKFREFVEETTIQVKFIATKFDWDYAYLLKFKNGQKNLSSERLNRLNSFMDDYLEAIKGI